MAIALGWVAAALVVGAVLALLMRRVSRADDPVVELPLPQMGEAPEEPDVQLPAPRGEAPAVGAEPPTTQARGRARVVRR
ncbi:MAG: hypothetical protein OJJ54_03770 [Pseudonocardia sp.]|nr:hypothetical protein [Pseudonocardia sp.]